MSTAAAPLDLRALCREDTDRWLRLMEANPAFERFWRRDDWMSYSWLLDHAIERMLGRTPDPRTGTRSVKVLEIGFGVGRGIHRMVGYMGVPEASVTGIELLPDLVELGRARWPAARLETVGPDLDGVLDWFAAEREAGNWYDLVVARHVFQFVPEPQRLLRAIAGVLPVERVFAFVVPMPGWSLHETTAVTEIPLAWEGVPNMKKWYSALTALQAATMRVPTRNFAWKGDPNWGPMLDAARLQVVEVGYRKMGSQHLGKEAYALCRRVG